MNIELRNVHYAAFASEETSCFDATIYIDGKKAGYAKNAGKGGCTDVDPQALAHKLNEHGKTLPPREHGAQDAESIINDLFYVWLAERSLKRLMRSHLLYTRPGQKGIWQTKKLPADVLARKVAECRALVEAGKPLPEAETCLNVLPMPEAVRLFREQQS